MKIPFISNAAGLARTSGQSLENDDRIAYQSARTRNGVVASLPLTEAQAWREVERRGVILKLKREFNQSIRSRS